MGRKGEPDPAKVAALKDKDPPAQSAPSGETTPPEPAAADGPGTSKAVAGKRAQVASGIGWGNMKNSRAVAKKLPKPTDIKAWRPMGEAMCHATNVGLMVFWGPKFTLKTERIHKDVPSEWERCRDAWAAQIAIMPIENVTTVVGLQLLIVYASIILPRFWTAWSMPIEEVEGVFGAGRRWGASLKENWRKKHGKEASAPEKDADGSGGDAGQSGKGDAGRSPEGGKPSGESPGGSSGRSAHKSV